MIILAIETSCDDTAVAVLKITLRRGSGQAPEFKVLSNIISSQVKLHAKYGGVFPSLAKREHEKNLPVVLKEALRLAKLAQNKHVDLIAVTKGPGLEPCLWVGINFAIEQARKLKVPLIGINHIKSHILANAISNKQLTKSNFPAICLIVSGGHTQIILMKDFGDYQILGETRDDAAGECFDKTARILGIGYPGGPIMAKEAAKFSGGPTSAEFEIALPRPMIHQKNYDFSFSGLKTAVLYDFKSRPKEIRESKAYIQEMCFKIQQAIIDVLIKKTIKTVKDFKAKTLILGGGVAANEELRRQFGKRMKKEGLEPNFLVPKSTLCTDNAAMIAATAYYDFASGKTSERKVEAEANLRLE